MFSLEDRNCLRLTAPDYRRSAARLIPVEVGQVGREVVRAAVAAAEVGTGMDRPVWVSGSCHCHSQYIVWADPPHIPRPGDPISTK